jgi:hypothetical protein
MTSRNHEGPTNDDELLPRLFRALGPAPELPSDMRRGWEATFGGELMRTIAAKRQRRNRIVSGCVGVVVLTTVAAYLLREPPIAPDIATAEVAQVVLVIGQVESSDAQATRVLSIGDELAAGQTLRTGPDTHLAFRYRDADVRLNANTVVALLPTRLQLTRGDVYVDSGTAPHRGPTVMIETPRGMLAHIGTQFEVSVADDTVRASVREGAIAFTSDGDHRTISADDGPTQIVISASGVATQRIAATGELWDWTIDAAPGYVVDGRTADEFLVWATRQMGTQLRYIDDAARFHSQTVIMHGTVRPLSVAQGLEVVNATTGLDVDESDPATLRVSVRRSNP